MEETYKFAGRLAELPQPVVRTIKRATYQTSRVDLRTALDMISSHMGVVRETEESKKAMLAALQRHAKK
jgi:enoyl-CoA hydratase/carnithine racemase